MRLGDGFPDSKGDALAMLDSPTATPWTRCTYDHRLRAQVVRTGTRCLPKHIWIPRSTVSTWRRRGQRPVVTIEPLDGSRPAGATGGGPEQGTSGAPCSKPGHDLQRVQWSASQPSRIANSSMISALTLLRTPLCERSAHTAGLRALTESQPLHTPHGIICENHCDFLVRTDFLRRTGLDFITETSDWPPRTPCQRSLPPARARIVRKVQAARSRSRNIRLPGSPPRWMSPATARYRRRS
jgi:hypothetical protein